LAIKSTQNKGFGYQKYSNKILLLKKQFND